MCDLPRELPGVDQAPVVLGGWGSGARLPRSRNHRRAARVKRPVHWAAMVEVGTPVPDQSALQCPNGEGPVGNTAQPSVSPIHGSPRGIRDNDLYLEKWSAGIRQAESARGGDGAAHRRNEDLPRLGSAGSVERST